MTLDEIFSELSGHMIQGMMVHEQLMVRYWFLNLPGYAKCHEYHYLSESLGHNRFLEFVTNRYDFLTSPGIPRDPGLIPKKLYEIRRQDVSMNQRVESIISCLNEWIMWENETLILYKSAYSHLIAANEIDAADFVNSYVKDVSEELIYAKNEQIAKESMNYDMPTIIEEQDAYEKRFTKKLRKLKEFK